MRDFSKKPQNIEEAKKLFPELSSEIDAVLRASPNFGERIVLAFIGEAMGAINNQKQNFKSNPQMGGSIAFIIEMLNHVGAERVLIDKIPEEEIQRRGFLKELKGESKAHTVSIMNTILLGKFDGLEGSIYEPYKIVDLVKNMSDLCNKFTDLAEKEIFGYNIEQGLRVEFSAVDKDLKDKLGYRCCEKINKDNIKNVDLKEKKEILTRYFDLMKKIKAEVQQNDDIDSDAKKRFLEEIDNDVSNKIASEILLAMKGNEIDKNFKEKYDGRIDKINNVFGEQIRQSKAPRSVLNAMQALIRRMGIDAVDDLVSESNREFFKQVLESPVLARVALGVLENSKNYRQDLVAVMDVVKMAFQDNARDGKVVINHKKSIEIFKEILSDGKGGVDPKAIEFLKIPGNAKKWVEALKIDPECLGKLAVAGKRFSSPEAQQWAQHLIDHPKEHKALFARLRVEGEITAKKLGELNEVFAQFYNKLKRDVEPELFTKFSDGKQDPYNVNVANSAVEKAMETRLDVMAQAFNVMLVNWGLEEVKKHENKEKVAKVMVETTFASVQSIGVLERLEPNEFLKLNFDQALQVYEKVMPHIVKCKAEKKNIHSIMGGLIVLASTQSFFFGPSIKTEDLIKCVENPDMPKFIKAYNEDPDLAKIILAEVKGNIKGAENQLKAFCDIYENMHVSTKIKDDSRIVIDIRKVIAECSKGFLFKTIDVASLGNKMKAVKASLKEYTKDVQSEKGKKYMSFQEQETTKPLNDEMGNKIPSPLATHISHIDAQGKKFKIINDHAEKIADPKNIDKLRKGSKKLHGGNSGDIGRSG